MLVYWRQKKLAQAPPTEVVIADGSPSEPPVMVVGDLEIRVSEGLVLADGRAVYLSPREFRLLVAMAHRAGHLVSREELYRSVWTGPWQSRNRSVDVCVSKLRTKLAVVMPHYSFIHTHRGFGYRLHQDPVLPVLAAVTRAPSPTNYGRMRRVSDGASAHLLGGWR